MVRREVLHALPWLAERPGNPKTNIVAAVARVGALAEGGTKVLRLAAPRAAAQVNNMIKVRGAPIKDADAKTIASYLKANYGG